MRTRSGARYYPSGGAQEQQQVGQKRKRGWAQFAGACGRRKRAASGGTDFLDELPDDLVLSILSKLAASASSPADLTSVLLTCKRLHGLGKHQMVLAKASPESLAVKAKTWSESAQRFLKRCSDAGNLEACYILGMIRFYCLGSRSGGAALLARAAVGGHAAALYALAVIQFNGSGGAKSDRDLRAGAALCARAAALGHVDALRELGHCLQDGYGVRRDAAEGRRLLVAANARELSLALAVAAAAAAAAAATASHCHVTLAGAAGCPAGLAGGGCPLLSDFGWSVPEAEAHPANRFMVEWWTSRAGEEAEGEGELRLCSHVRCGRRETRRHEFRRCSVCGAANYCSRACQALDWKRAHKAQCAPMDRWLVAGAAAAAPAVDQ